MRRLALARAEAAAALAGSVCSAEGCWGAAKMAKEEEVEMAAEDASAAVEACEGVEDLAVGVVVWGAGAAGTAAVVQCAGGLAWRPKPQRPRESIAAPRIRDSRALKSTDRSCAAAQRDLARWIVWRQVSRASAWSEGSQTSTFSSVVSMHPFYSHAYTHT